MNKMYLIFSHSLTKPQIREGKERFNVEEFVYLPSELQKLWSNVDPYTEDEEVYLKMKDYIINNVTKEDYLLIEGEYGLTFKLVSFAIKKGYKVLYSKTERVYEKKEREDGSIYNIHKFNHVRFSFYKEEILMDERVKRTMENLEKNNMEAYYVKNKKELLKKLEELLCEGEVVSCGGSMTLEETGALELLRNGKYQFLDRYKEGLTGEDIKNIYRKSFFADAYLVSTNALTEEGELYNVDGNGNRVAAMLYGPDKVIVIAGVNKIVKDFKEAVDRNREIAAPKNAKRLNRNTPCTKVGHCMDCSSKDRICNEYVLIKRQREKGRIKIIIVEENLGY